MVRANQLAVAVLAAAAVCGSAAAADPAQTLKIGMPRGMFRDIQPNLVKAMSGPLREMIGKRSKLDGEVEIVPDAHALADRMSARQLHFGVFHGFEYAWIAQQHPEIVPLVVTIPPGRKVQGCVVVRKDNPARKLADLGDAAVAIPRGAKAHTLLFLEKLRIGLPATTARPVSDPGKTAEDVLDAVVMGESPAALVDAAALSGYQTLQPGAYKQLRMLCESERFPQAVIAYRRGAVDDGVVAQAKAGLLSAHTTVTSKPLLMLWNLKGFEEVPADYPQRLAEIRKAYPPPDQPSGAN